MKKVSLIALKSDREQILARLHKFGELHISQVSEEQSEAPGDYSSNQALAAAQERLAGVDAAISRLKRFDDREKSLLPQPRNLSYGDIKDILADSGKLLEIVEISRALEDKRAEFKASLIRNENLADKIEPWYGLDIRVEDIRDTGSCRVMAGTIPVLDSKAYLDEFDDIENLYVEKIYTDREYVYAFILYHNSDNEEMFKLLTRAGFVEAAFSGLLGTPESIFEELRLKRDEMNHELEEIQDREMKLASNLSELEKLSDALRVHIDRLEKSASFGGTQYVFYLTGYIAAHMQQELERAIAQELQGAYSLEITDPEPSDDVPTLIENRAAVRPFESVTDMFGTPERGSTDPNTVMAPFYVMFFGIMLSDAGYGIILAVAASILYKLTSTKGKTKSGNKLVGVIAFGGVFTFIWGLMFGGLMGFDIRPLWFNPMQEPLMMLGLCFGLGIVHIISGMAMRFFILLKRKQYLAAVAEQLTWIVFLVGIVLFVLPMLVSMTGGEPSGPITAIGGAGKFVTLTGLASILVLGGYNKKGFGRIFGGISSLYGITGYLSDILSYSRLFALGLATGVIGMVIKVVVDLIWPISFIGPIIASLIFVGGHIFNIAINTLGAYVHSSRLQYIEFFGKFFEGGGKPFKPFVPKTKYYKVKD